jgi:hypothetical protein
VSRVIVTRYPDGEEHIVVGYDRPLGTFFAHEYDEDGDPKRAVYGVPEPVTTPIELALRLGREDWPMLPWDRLTPLLMHHQTLDYPESNVVVDLTREVVR